MQNELFEKTAVPEAYLKLAMPVVLSSVLTLVYNLVDTYFIGQTGNADLVAGVALCTPVFTLLIAMGDIFGLGGSSVISRMLGAGKKEDARRMSVFCLDGAFLFGILIAVILLVFRYPVLSLLGASGTTMIHAEAYYFWIALGSPFVILALAPTNLLRTEGHAVQAMIGSVIGSIVNIILDPVFIFGLNMGAGGAALATIIGNICSDIFYVLYIHFRADVLTMRLKGFHISRKEVGQISGIGIPSSITNLVQSIGVIILNHFLLIYGNDKIAAYGIVSKVISIVVMILVGFAFGGQPLYGYLYGAGNKKRLKQVMKFAYELEIGVSIAVSVILYLFSSSMIGIFMKDAGIVSTGVPMMRAYLLGMPFEAVVLVTTCLFQSTGKAWQALVLSAGRQGVFYAVIIVILNALAALQGVIHAQAVSDLVTAAVALILLNRTLMPELHSTID